MHLQTYKKNWRHARVRSRRRLFAYSKSYEVGRFVREITPGQFSLSGVCIERNHTIGSHPIFLKIYAEKYIPVIFLAHLRIYVILA